MPAVFWIAVVACADSRPEGWAESTHGKDTLPAYDLLFSMDQVHTVEISIAPSDFQAMQANVSNNWPLISRLISDPVYQERYRGKLEHALLGLFEVEAATARMRELHELVGWQTTCALVTPA